MQESGKHAELHRGRGFHSCTHKERRTVLATSTELCQITPKIAWLRLPQSRGTYLCPCWRSSGVPNTSSGRDQLCALWPKVNLQSSPGGKTSISEVLRSSHPEGKCTTATLKPPQKALKRGPALLNGSQDHPIADTADYTHACWGWSKGSWIHHFIATN